MARRARGIAEKAAETTRAAETKKGEPERDRVGMWKGGLERAAPVGRSGCGLSLAIDTLLLLSPHTTKRNLYVVHRSPLGAAL